MSRALRAPALALLALGLSTSACVPFADNTYPVDVIFPRATALFPDSRVKVMGADVGKVRTIKIEGTRLRVTLAIKNDVPIPARARAAIVPFTLVGERNVVLTPPWKVGQERLGAGDTIPVERTEIPFEPDEALEALRDLAKAVNPNALSRLVSKAAESVKGRGKDFNAALEGTGALSTALGDQDEVLEEIARNFHTLASGLNQREQKLGRVINSFSRVSGVLAEERDNIAAFLDALARLPREGQFLLANFQKQIPQDLAIIAKVLMVAESNIESIEQLIDAFPDITENLIGAYEPNFRALVLRVSASASSAPILQGLLSPLGVDNVPCVPAPDVACP